MSPGQDMLLATLALQRGRITVEQLAAAARKASSTEGASVCDTLVEDGSLDATALASLEALVALGSGTTATLAGDSPSLGLEEGLDDSGLLMSGEAPGSTSAAPVKAPSPVLRDRVTRIIDKPGDARYLLGEEIGRGGLGRVRAARDAVLGREVAVKEMIRGAESSRLLERFLREGEIAGRLSHPNVIPIHDIGFREEGPGRLASRRIPYFVMTRIDGRDLKEIIEALRRGSFESEAREEGESLDPRREYTRPRLLRLFQDVCLGVAYAHAHGVVHRDLKPANVMIGQYGEVYIVDWGLAKLIKPADQIPHAALETDGTEAGSLSGGGDALGEEPLARDAQAIQSPPESDRGEHPDFLTLDGEVVGTPAYMPPEQARGLSAEIDGRSDIYSLGAILYEILTLCPPFEGKSALHVIGQVIAGELKPPSARESPEAVPLDLEEIVLKSMAYGKEDRYASALEIHEELQKYLEGEKEKKRKKAESTLRVKKGTARLSSYRKLAKKIEALETAEKGLTKKLKPWSPLEEKRRLWDLQDETRRLREKRTREFTGADAAFVSATLADPSNHKGLEGRCALYFERYLEAELRGDREETTLCRGFLEELDKTGKWRKRLDKPGKLKLVTFERTCRCLSAAPAGELQVSFGSAAVLPFVEGEAVPGAPAAAADRPVPALTVVLRGRSGLSSMTHGPGCGREPLEGAEVWAFKHVLRDRVLKPEEGRLLGHTPLSGTTLEQGSYLLKIRLPGFSEALAPVLIERGGEWNQEVELLPEGALPPGFGLVQGGPFISGDRGPRDSTIERRKLKSFLMARRPVTLSEYLLYLEELFRLDPEEARARQPREAGTPFLEESGGKWVIPEGGGLEGIVTSLELPLFGVSWQDALAFCAWKSAREGLLFTPPHEDEYEKAARGVDGRRYPWGDAHELSHANTNFSLESGPRLLPAGSMPVDVSPYGILDLAGNMSTWCLNSPGEGYLSDRLIKGGAWCFSNDRSRAAMRLGLSQETAHRHTGLRLVLRPFGIEAEKRP